MKKHPKPASKEKLKATKKNSSAKSAPGSHALHEIVSQPETWTQTAQWFEARDRLRDILPVYSAKDPWLFVACGSSYYLSRTIAARWSKLLGVACTGVPASELLFAREELLRRTGAKQVALISRSGKTTEVLRAAEWLNSCEGVRTLGVTCSDHSDLQRSCTHTLKLTWADEKSLVMTRSFTTILLLFERIGAQLAGDPALAAILDGLPKKTSAWLGENADKIRAFAAKRRFADYVFLGQGAHYWLAQEGALKMTEMSASYAQAYHTLEFRHGPKSIAGPRTLITFLLSEAAAEEEAPLIGELKKLGAAIAVVANRATPELRRSSDLLIELGFDEPEFARMAATAIPAQLMGQSVGVRKGLDPDLPKNLSRAVILDSGQVRSAKRSNA